MASCNLINRLLAVRFVQKRNSCFHEISYTHDIAFLKDSFHKQLQP